MAEKLDPEEIVTLEELLHANTITQEALINLLVKQGIITKEKLIEEIKRVKRVTAEGE